MIQGSLLKGAFFDPIGNNAQIFFQKIMLFAILLFHLEGI